MARPERPPREATEITPSFCCSCYLISSIFCLAFALFFTYIVTYEDTLNSCYVELFANSVSVSASASASNANVSAADWRIGFVTTTPVTGCSITLHPIKSRLLRGDQVINSDQSLSDEGFLGQSIAAGDEINLAFKTAVMPEVVNGSVIWDFRVEMVFEVKKPDSRYDEGLLLVYCDDIPMKFTADQAGNMMGSLLGYIRRCAYAVQDD